MNVFLVGAGPVTSEINQVLTSNNHKIVASFANFDINHVSIFDYKVLIVVAGEGSVLAETLRSAVVEQGKTVFVFAEAGNPLGAWALASGVKAFQFPPTQMDLDGLLAELRQIEAGNVDEAMQYRRMSVGSDIASRIQSGMATRKIAVTSPKGGAGKTTVAVNLAITFALCGITTYIADCDANVGALTYHLRMRNTKHTFPTVLRKLKAEKTRTTNVPGAPLQAAAAGGLYLDAFTQLPNLATLRALPGFNTDDLSDGIFNDNDLLRSTMQGLYEVGPNVNGVTIMDIGINPTHPLHAFALQSAEAIAIVIKPEVPDIAYTRDWIRKMIKSLSSTVGEKAAIEFISSHVKLVYNMASNPKTIKEVHKLFQDTLDSDKLGITFAPNAIIPLVSADLSSASVNSDDLRDILTWRYLTDHTPELAQYAGSMVDFATHFVPVVRESAQRVGLVPSDVKNKKKGISGLFARA